LPNFIVGPTYRENNRANKCAGPWTTGPKRTLGEFAPLQINHNCIIVRKNGTNRQTNKQTRDRCITLTVIEAADVVKYNKNAVYGSKYES